MAYKKILIGFGTLHLLILIFLIIIFLKNDYKVFNENSGNTSLSIVKQSAFQISKPFPNDEYLTKEFSYIKELLVFCLAIISFIPFLFFSTVIVKKLKKYRKKQVELMDENKSKDLFFSIISHDLKTPAQHLIALSELIHKTQNLNSQDYQKISALINSCAKKHFELLNNLLDWSSSQLHNTHITKTMCNVYQLIDGQISAQKEKADEKNITIQNKVPENLIIRTNENLLGTVLRNLLNNAIKFTPIDGSVTFTSHFDSNLLTIKITDTGLGMKEETLLNLFNLKYTRSLRGTNKEVGSGIGLILCKEIIEKLNGKIMATSMENEGSTFIIEIPVE